MTPYQATTIASATPVKEPAKHTPGPWATDRDPDRRFLVYCNDATGSLVARTGGNGFEYVNTSDAEQEANARLIAAAPDLLAALKALVAKYGFGDTLPADHPLVGALATIAKAEGRSA
jgi:hypothetical protein